MLDRNTDCVIKSEDINLFPSLRAETADHIYPNFSKKLKLQNLNAKLGFSMKSTFK